MRVISLIADYPRAGKSTVAQTLVTLVPRARVLPMARGVKAMADALLTSAGVSGPRLRWCQHQGKEELIPELGVSYRMLCQKIGTELGRQQFGEDFWVNIWQKQVDDLSNDGHLQLLIVDDQRFVNEAKATRDLGGVVWRVKRPEMEGAYRDSSVTSHASEGELSNYPCDWTIMNVGTVSELVKATIAAWEALAEAEEVVAEPTGVSA